MTGNWYPIVPAMDSGVTDDADTASEEKVVGCIVFNNKKGRVEYPAFFCIRPRVVF